MSEHSNTKRSVRVCSISSTLSDKHTQNEYFKKALQSKVIPRLLAEGLVKPSKVREVGGATLLERVTAGFDVLRKGLSGERVVIKVSEA